MASVNCDRLAHILSRTVTTPGGCMEFQGCIQSNGYSRITINHVTDYGHRHAYRLANGEIGEGLDVRHTCDNRPCINPAHLITGTRLQNMRDAVSRGRQAKGSRLPQTKISEESKAAITELAKAGVPYRVIAAQYGIVPQHAGYVALNNGVRRNGIGK